MFLLKFPAVHIGEGGSCHRKQLDVEQSIRLRISDGVQSKLLGVDSNRRFVERDLIRTPSGFGLQIGLVHRA